MYTINSIINTLFKSSPLQSSELNEDDIKPFNKGESFQAISIEETRNEHILVEVESNSIFKDKKFFLYEPHVSVTKHNGSNKDLVIDKDYPYPNQYSIDLPHFSQLDNFYNPTGSCNVTSVAMCLYYLGIRPSGKYTQLEDELYNYMIDNGLSRHSPHDLAKVIRQYGFIDDFKTHCTISDCKKHIYQKDMPLIIHGYFTSFGHIIAVRGFNEKGFYVNDPYGEWFPNGYRTDLSGENLLYSYDMIKRLCIPDGSFWVHFIDK